MQVAVQGCTEHSGYGPAGAGDRCTHKSMAFSTISGLHRAGFTPRHCGISASSWQTSRDQPSKSIPGTWCPSHQLGLLGAWCCFCCCYSTSGQMSLGARNWQLMMGTCFCPRKVPMAVRAVAALHERFLLQWDLLLLRHFLFV